MARESAVFGSSVLVVVVGLVLLLYGEYAHIDGLVYGGGVVALLAVGVIAGTIARLDHA